MNRKGTLLELFDQLEPTLALIDLVGSQIRSEVIHDTDVTTEASITRIMVLLTVVDDRPRSRSLPADNSSELTSDELFITVHVMDSTVNRRPYRSQHRQEAAQRTRAVILDVARELFSVNGYAATTMDSIAQQAGVAVDTVYEAVGPKPVLLKRVVSLAIFENEDPAFGRERPYLAEIMDEPDPGRKLERYARAVRTIHERFAPLSAVLQTAARTAPDLAALWDEIKAIGLGNVGTLVANLEETGSLRPGVSPDQATDVVWTMTHAELYVTLVGQRGWSPEAFEAWLATMWKAFLLEGGVR